MAVGMFDNIGEMTATDLYVAPPRGTSGVIRYTGGPVKPSDLIRDELAETQFIRDFLTEFSDKLGDKDASEWIRVLGEYATGEAELSELEAVDVSDLMEIEGFEDYYYGVVPRPLTEDTGISDQDAISAIMATVPNKLKGLITEDNIIKILKEVAKMNDPMTQIKRDMGAGIQIEFPEDWKNWKVFGPLAIPGVPLPPGIIDVTLGEISDAVSTIGKKIEDFIDDPLGTLGELGDWVTKKVKGVFGGTEKDPGWGGSLGGFEDWVIGVLGNVVGGSVLVDVYDNVKDVFETDTTAVVGGTDTETDDKEDSTDRFSQLLETVQTNLETDDVVDITADSTLDDDTIGGGSNSTDLFSSLLGTVTKNLEVDDTKKSDDIVIGGGDLEDPDDYPPRGTYASAYCETRGDTGGTLVTNYHDGAGGTYSESSFSSSCKTIVPGGGGGDDDLNFDDDPIEIGGEPEPEAAMSGGGAVGGGQASATPFMKLVPYTRTVPLSLQPSMPTNYASGLMAAPTMAQASGLMRPTNSMDLLGQIIARNMKA